VFPQQLTLDGVRPPLHPVRERPPATAAGRSPLACPHEVLRQLWCVELPTLPEPVSPWTGSPASYLRARWRELATEAGWSNIQPGIDWFRGLFAYVGRSRFLMGQIGPRPLDRRPFECTLEWLVKAENWRKVRQGLYHDHRQDRR